mgnify:CR=1 FL=1
MCNSGDQANLQFSFYNSFNASAALNNSDKGVPSVSDTFINVTKPGGETPRSSRLITVTCTSSCSASSSCVKPRVVRFWRITPPNETANFSFF